MKTVKEIEKEINSLEKKLETVQGRSTEVYSRIVGYYRSVRNWNKGKREEYNYRMKYNPINIKKEFINAMEDDNCGCAVVNMKGNKQLAAGYSFFYRTTCPNCPPVKALLAELPLVGNKINVDEPEGLKSAEKYGVMSAPTVIFFDQNGAEIFRTNKRAEIEKARDDGDLNFFSELILN